MVSTQAKKQALDYTISLLDTGLYVAQKQDSRGVLIDTKSETLTNARQIYIVLANATNTVDHLKSIVNENSKAGIYTCPILFKDGETAFVRLADKHGYEKRDRSLKYYNSTEFNRIIFLRDRERAVVEMSEQDVLTYYQPTTARLKESLRQFDVERKVALDYSHLTPEQRRQKHVELTAQSLEYVLPEELDTIGSPAQFEFHQRKGRKLAALVSAEQIQKNPILTIDQDIAAMARHQLGLSPEVDLEDVLELWHPEEN